MNKYRATGSSSAPALLHITFWTVTALQKRKKIREEMEGYDGAGDNKSTGNGAKNGTDSDSTDSDNSRKVSVVSEYVAFWHPEMTAYHSNVVTVLHLDHIVELPPKTVKCIWLKQAICVCLLVCTVLIHYGWMVVGPRPACMVPASTSTVQSLSCGGCLHAHIWLVVACRGGAAVKSRSLTRERTSAAGTRRIRKTTRRSIGSLRLIMMSRLGESSLTLR